MTRQATQGIQVSIKIQVPTKRKVKITSEFCIDVLKYRFEHGEDPPGISITGITWKDKTYTDPDNIDDILAKLSVMERTSLGVFHKVR